MGGLFRVLGGVMSPRLVQGFSLAGAVFSGSCSSRNTSLEVGRSPMRQGAVMMFPQRTEAVGVTSSYAPRTCDRSVRFWIVLFLSAALAWFAPSEARGGVGAWTSGGPAGGSISLLSLQPPTPRALYTGPLS